MHVMPGGTIHVTSNGRPGGVRWVYTYNTKNTGGPEEKLQKDGMGCFSHQALTKALTKWPEVDLLLLRVYNHSPPNQIPKDRLPIYFHMMRAL